MISKEQIKHIASLANIDVDESEIPHLADQLSKIIEYVETINELDLKNIKPTAHAVEVNNVFREDKVIQKDIIEKSLEQAPESDGVYFKVPKVI